MKEEAGGTRHAADDSSAKDLSRRQLLGLMAAAPFAGSLSFAPPALDRALRAAEAAHAATIATGAPFAPKFFTAHEWRTVRMLVDYLIPRDAKSGSATDAGVPEFMDFMMIDRPDSQTWMRGGLAWLDTHCEDHHGKSFVESSLAQRAEVLDAIAYPRKAPLEMGYGVAFFNRFRDLTASGFWSSRIGITDLQYKGNMMMPSWNGCPDAALAKLGVSYKDVGY